MCFVVCGKQQNVGEEEQKVEQEEGEREEEEFNIKWIKMAK